VVDGEARSASGAETGGAVADRIAGPAEGRHRVSACDCGETTGVRARS
jgi:hypothetical protein